MSDNLPFEIQTEIINKVFDLKSLIRFRSVSKRWKSLIESSQFIAHHAINSIRTNPHHLLVRYCVNAEEKYVSVVDDDNDDSVPRHKSSSLVSPVTKLRSYGSLLGGSHGLLCLYGDNDTDKKRMMVIWNPSIRKSVRIPLPPWVFGSNYQTTIGFGVCPKTSDPKIVKIVAFYKNHQHNDYWLVWVFTLSSRVWKSISMNIELPQSTQIIHNNYNPVVGDGFIYWVANVTSNERNLIISFDLTSEEFAEVELPTSLARAKLHIFKMKESLVVLDWDSTSEVYYVWKMVKNELVRVITLGKSEYDGGIIGFRSNGQPIRIQKCRPEGTFVRKLEAKLEAYEPSAKRYKDIGICLSHDPNDSLQIMITPYTESLLLLNTINQV